uniref:RING-type domain-containing protein n=1 Tax=Davidia involucrata TaxID=16924 RepID=A0A5B7BNT7_DAVIN
MAVLIEKQERLNRYTNNDAQIVPKTLSNVSGLARKRKNQELMNSDKKEHILEEEERNDNGGSSPKRTKTSIEKRMAWDTKGVHGKGISQKHRGASNKKIISDDEFSLDEWKDENDEEEEKHKDNVGSSPTITNLSLKKSKVTQEIEGFHGKRISERCRAASNKKRIVEKDYYFCEWIDDEEEEDFIEIETGKRSRESNGVKMKRGGIDEWVDDDEEEDFIKTKTRNKSRYSDGVKMKRTSRDKREKNNKSRNLSLYNSSSSSSSSNSCSSVSVLKSDGNSVDRCTGKMKENGEECLKCHQCKRKDRRIVVPCTKCKEKLYCIQCIKQWYPHLSEEEIAHICPFCHGNCNCNMCLHSSGMIKTSKRDLTSLEKVQHLHYLISSLLPFLKQIHEEQTKEIEMESVIQATIVQLLSLTFIEVVLIAPMSYVLVVAGRFARERF